MKKINVQTVASPLDNCKQTCAPQGQTERGRAAGDKKLKTYPLYIPCSIDIDDLLRQYPAEGIGNARDKLVYLMHLIHEVPAFRKDVEALDGFTILSSTIVQGRIKEYARLFGWLQERKIIETNGHYKPGIRSMGYRFANSYRAEIKKVPITSSTLINSIKRKKGNKPILSPDDLSHLHEAEFDITGYSYQELAVEMLAYLHKWFNHLLRMDKEEAIGYLKRLQSREELDSSVDDPQYKFNCRVLPVHFLSDHLIRFAVDGTAGRLHTPLTALKSDLRAFVRYNGSVLKAADLRNSQPLLSLVFLDWGLFSKNRMLERISRYNGIFGSGDCDMPPTQYATMLGDFIKSHSQADDILLYRKLVLSGYIYESFGNALRKEGLAPESSVSDLRKFAKSQLFGAIFSKNAAIRYSPCLRVFQAIFPNVYRIFRMVKEGAHNTLACSLQNIEAEVVLHQACKEISVNRPDIPLFTIHDSIATIEEHIEYVRDVLSRHVFNLINAYPEIKIERWDDSLLFKGSKAEVDIKVQEPDHAGEQPGYGYASDEPVYTFHQRLYSMSKVSRRAGVGRNILFRGLRALNILRKDNTPIDDNGEYFIMVLTTGFRGSRYTIRVTGNGFGFVKKLIAAYPGLFPIAKRKGGKNRKK